MLGSCRSRSAGGMHWALFVESPRGEPMPALAYPGTGAWLV